jgi:hypothetical protein
MMTVFNSTIEGTMIVIPGLSRSLDTVGKHLVSLDYTNGRLFVEARSVVQRAIARFASAEVHECMVATGAGCPTRRHSVGRLCWLSRVRRFKRINSQRMPPTTFVSHKVRKFFSRAHYWRSMPLATFHTDDRP